jgi:hypothetical protein
MIKISKDEIFNYLIISIVIFYIFYISDISINYLFGFIIISIIIYYIEYNKSITKGIYNERLSNINKNLLHHKYKYIEKNIDIMYLLDEIKIFNKYNPDNFALLLKELDIFYKNKEKDNYFIVEEIYENFIYSIPIDIVKYFYINKIKLKNIMNINVQNGNYLPHNYNSIK